MKRLFFILLLTCVLMPRHVHALAGEWQTDEAVKVRLISGIDAVGQEKTIPLGLEINLEHGWHTYWRSPGAAGLPPNIDWKESLTEANNLEEATLLYPAPKRYTEYGLETIGYRDHIIFPIDAKLRASGQALNVDANLNLLICSAICVPKTFSLKLTIPAGDLKESAEAPSIKQFRDLIPGGAEKSGLVIKSIGNDGQSYTFTVESRYLLQDPDIFIENDKSVMFAAPITSIASTRQSVVFNVKPADTLPEGTTLADLKLTLTVVNGDHALEQKSPAPPISETIENNQAPGISSLMALLFALIGGFILNLMPCVLPVLSLKLLSVVGHGGGEAKAVRQSFLVVASGILFSFFVLALITLLLKELGMMFGWGVQFQQPVFLTCLILLLTFFAANLWGLFEIPLPQWLADNLNDAAYHPKLAGDFATGAFATLLATPCTAPFLGTAVGFALASGPFTILLIFFAIGLGMTLPYLAIAAFPRFATALPKPGPWMVKLRHILGWALGATAVWLIWVLSAQISVRYAVIVGLCMFSIIILFGMQKKTSIRPHLIKIGMLDFVMIALGITLVGSFMPKTEVKVDALWLPFSENTLAANIQEGKTVFVDITADWCLTCKANKKFILSKGEVAQRLFHSDIVAMQGDWTNADPKIDEFLHKYGRYGIPFNAVFGPATPQGIVLPELLTSKIVLEALDQAKKPAQP